MKRVYRSGRNRSQSSRAIESLESRLLLSTTRYVDINSIGPAHNGASWATAYLNPQEALAAAVSGDTIRVADGTYNPTAGTDRNISFNLKTGVSLLGGYAGYGASDPNARDIAGSMTILSGDIGTIGTNTDNSYHVVLGSGTTATAVLDGFTITAGNANGSSSPTNSGGGMYISAGSPTVTNCTYSANSASHSGGGMYNAASPKLTNCTFIGNSASYAGGGMYNGSSSPTLANCIFSGNSASGTNGNGGGMYNASSSPALTNCTFSGNSANTGGAMYNSSSSAMLTSCTFSGNAALGGGGMHNSHSSPALTNCSFSGNSANTGGAMYNALSSAPALTNCTFSGNSVSGSVGYAGGILNDSSSPTLINCAFSGNSASNDGGGMYNGNSSSLTLINCSFSGNSARRGGGIYNDYHSSPALTNCTFSGNLAGSGGWANNGGGMYNYESSPNLTNCVIWGSGSSPIYTAGGTPVITYSDIEGGYSGTGNINADPLFVRSPWTGPDGTLATADDDYGDLRLRPGSPVLDVGFNAAVPTGITTDRAGNPRIQNGTVDMGAHEGATSVPVPKTLYVDLTAVGINTGTSWANAFFSLQSALAAAVDGDTIRVADGTYKPTATADRTCTFSLRNSVRVYGGYSGYGEADPDGRDMAANLTILSGDIGTIDSNTDNSYHVVVGSGTDARAVLDGFIITAGNANGSYPANSGGGLYNSGGSPTLNNCTFNGNSASYGGGTANYSSSSLSLNNCTLSGNSASNYGGGIYNRFSSPSLNNCTFGGNSAGQSGGGMYNYTSFAPTLTNCIIWGNGSSPIYNAAGTPVITYSDIQGGWTGTGNIGADPLFVRNPSAGPDTVWGTADDDYGDLRLQASSPCIDAASNAAVPANITTDLAGNPRFADVPGVHDTAAIVDMGAYEYPVTLAGSGGSFLFAAAKPSVRISFNANVASASLLAGDLVLQNLTTGQFIDCGASSTASFDLPTCSATWAFSTMLPDGNYRATLPAGSVSDAAGNPLISDYSFEFFALAGDANHDRTVDITDLGILATNWQGSGKTFAQGDFNYDGIVDISDLGILATNWQKSIPAPSPTVGAGERFTSSPIAATPATPVRRPDRPSLAAEVIG